MTREEAIKAFRGLSGVLLPREYYREAIQMAISALQQPEIILCSDCKHFVRNIPCVEGHYNGCDAWTDNGNEIMVAEDDYCSYAERQEE